MYYFKKIKQDGSLDMLQSCSNDISECDKSLILISEAEYNELSAEMDKSLQEEQNLLCEATIAEQERIQNLEKENAELEKENASLLYQILTGEELADV